MLEDRTKLVVINSVNRSLGTPSDFTVAFRDGCILAAAGETVGMEVVDACINRSWYTVSSSNNTFSLLLSGVGTTLITIPVGFYDVYSLRSTLQTLLGANWSVTYSAITNCYTYTYTQSTNYNVYALIFSGNRCSELMGFGVFTGTAGILSYGLPLVSLIPIKINKENSVLVHCDVSKTPCATLDNCSTTVFAESDIILKICNSCAPFDNMVYQCAGESFRHDLAVQSLASMRFYVTDENNTPLPLNFDWTLTLKFIFSKGDEDRLLGLTSEIKDYLNLIVLNNHMKNKML